MVKIAGLLFAFLIAIVASSAAASDDRSRVFSVDPSYVDQWHLKAIEAEAAWEMVDKIFNPITVAVIDSGIDYSNPDLSKRLAIKKQETTTRSWDDDENGFIDDIIGWNFYEENNKPWDDNGHGTFISSLIAGAHNNGFGGKGVCPVCLILPIRFIGADGLGDNFDAVRAIEYAINSDAKVINLSFGDTRKDNDIVAAVKKAQDKDVLVVIAAGNWGWNNDQNEVYPANLNLPFTLTVAATNKAGDLWVDSAWGIESVQIAAPGEGVFGSTLNNNWESGNGTSLATPLVAGVAGMIRAANPNLSAKITKQILLATVTKNSQLKNKVASGGILNAKEAVKCALDQKLPCLKL